MPVAEFGYNGNGVETSVFRQRRWDDFQRVCVCLEAVRFHAL